MAHDDSRSLPTYQGEDSEGVGTQASSPEHQGARLAFPQVVPRGDEEASLEEPWFPDAQDATEANQQAIAEHGQSNHALLRPDVLEGALGRAQNYYHYENDLPKAAAALTHGIGQAQAFEDGNKRTAYHLGRIFMHMNGMGNVSPLGEDDDELADHLIGYGEGTHQMEDTANLFRQRMGQRQAAFEDPHVPPMDELMQRAYPSGVPIDHQECYETARAFAGKGGYPNAWYPDLSYEEGTYERGEGDHPGHAWVKTPAGTLIDAAHGQFDPEHPVVVIPPNHPNYRRYRAESMDARQSNILDPIHDSLDARVWDSPLAAAPTLRHEHSQFIYEKILTTLDEQGYDGMEKWLSIVFTGSLTTYQYSDDSDVDISLFVDVDVFPEWSRAEMIVAMIHNCDGTTLPGTPFPLQCFVVPPEVKKEDLYQPGTRSGYDMATDTWIVPPDRTRVHDVQREMNESYTIALENADKMESLLRYEPDKAVMFWHQIHKRRQRDMKKGKGDYSPSNVTYKMLANRGLFPQISDASGEYIASTAKTRLDLSGLLHS